MTDRPDELTQDEIEVLEMLADERPGTWGAWVSACLEVLHARGYSTGGPSYQITNKGREYLISYDRYEDLSK